jgi:hypothetical protein
MIDPSFDVVKLVGFEEDERDYYYTVYCKSGKSCISCVGKLIPLKGSISDADYKGMVHGWDLNPHIWAYEKVYDKKAFNKSRTLLKKSKEDV